MQSKESDSNLSFEAAFMDDGGVVIGFELGIFFFKLLALPPGPPVLEPHRHLAGVEAELRRQLILPLRL